MSGTPISLPGSCPHWRSWVLTQATLGLLLGNLGVKISPVSLCLRTLESSAGRVFGQGIALYCGCCYCYLVQTLSPPPPPPPHLTTSSPFLIETHSGDSRGFSVYIYNLHLVHSILLSTSGARTRLKHGLFFGPSMIHWSMNKIQSDRWDSIRCLRDRWSTDGHLYQLHMNSITTVGPG